ncbi:MAG: DinB family protein [Chloroflexota bacterium]
MAPWLSFAHPSAIEWKERTVPHPLVLQLRFTRSEFRRALAGLSDADARQRLTPMNCISWNIGHLAWQEQRYFLLYYGQSQLLLPEIDKLFAYGAPASTPALADMWSAWNTITRAADPWLDTMTTERLQQFVVIDGKPTPYIFGSLLQRVIYHYWYHLGENLAIRQKLGHTDLPEFVGDIDGEAPYRPE